MNRIYGYVRISTPANTVPIATPARTFSHSLPEFEPNSAGHEPNLLYNGYGTPCA